MSATELEEAYDLFWEDLLFEAEASAEPQGRAFFQLLGDMAAQNGDCIDLAYAPVRREGRGGYQIDGYALDGERGDLYLAVSDFRSSRSLETLNAQHIDTLLERVRRFCELAVQPSFITGLEETSPAFAAAWTIHESRARIRRIRVIVLSNARLSTRRRPELAGEVLNVPFVGGVLDFARYLDIQKAHGGADPVQIDVSELNGSPLSCLPAHTERGDYASYLVAMPGRLLAEIYGLYGARLLEQNVRTFLQARTKVNAGIIRTLETAPEMFFAYNNGITATASGVETAPMPDGSVGISAVENLQIVNGGQTTASILYAKDQRKADLDGVFVQMKLSVVRPDRLDEIVPKISRFANTQNKISEADFFSSHPVHLALEQISRRLPAPAKAGSLSGSKWFYERARGQYRDRQAYGTAAERRRFEVEFPRDQFFDKTDLAKYETTFACRPHIVSRGAQKCFLDFADGVSKAWEASEAQFNDHWFRAAVAKAIVFRWLDRMIGKADWYQADRGYKAQVITYSIAWLVQRLESEGREIAVDLVWQQQTTPDEIGAALQRLAPQVAATLKAAPPQMKNVGEYCKQQACWAAVAGSAYDVNLPSSAVTIDRAHAQQLRKDAAAVRKLDRDIDLDYAIAHLLGKTEPLTSFARTRRIMTPKSDAALRRLARRDVGLTSSERSGLKSLLEKADELGFILTPSERRQAPSH